MSHRDTTDIKSNKLRIQLLELNRGSMMHAWIIKHEVENNTFQQRGSEKKITRLRIVGDFVSVAMVREAFRE